MSGKLPVRLFWKIFRICTGDDASILDGTVPVNLFALKSRYVSLDNDANALGMVALILLWPRSRTINFDNLPIDEGILPDSLLPRTMRYSILTRSENEGK